MSNEESKSDAVKEARELLNSPYYQLMTFQVRKLLSSLCGEVEQLRSLNQTQAESIAEFQREQKELRQQINKLVNSDFVCSRCGSPKK